MAIALRWCALVLLALCPIGCQRGQSGAPLEQATTSTHEAVVETKPEPAARPNIVFILADDLGYGDLGCYGCRDIRTPNIDRLARDGVRLTDAYAAACVCSPSRAALMTGRYPQRSGFEWVVDYGEIEAGLPVKESCLASSLKSAGYTTGLFGKWHLGYKREFGPNAHGFDQFFGFLGPDLDYYSHRGLLGEPGLYENTQVVEQAGYLTDLLTDRGIAFLETHRRGPFFLCMAYNAPHYPFQRPNQPNDVRNKSNYGPTHGTRADYVQMVERLDHGVGRLLQKLDQLGLSQDTLVCFMSDNGGDRLSDNGPLFHGKFTLWEGGVRVPCIFRWPNRLTANTVSKQPIITMDLTATFLSLAGAPAETIKKLDGQDIMPILQGKQPLSERTLCWRIRLPGETLGQKAVRRGRWKYLKDRRGELLVDLERDPSERINLARREPKEFEEMRTALATWEAGMPALKD